MDTVVSNAITAVGLQDSSQLQTWFEVLCTTYRDQASSGSPDWEPFAVALRGRADDKGLPRAAIDAFIDYLAENSSSPIDVIDELNENGDRLPELYEQLTTAGDSTPEDQNTTYDESAWNAFLAANGPRWNGEESAWGQFGEWFRYEAAQQGVAVPAGQFLTYVDGQSDKVATFAQYGIAVETPEYSQAPDAPVSGPDISTFPEIAEGDSGEWVDYLDAMLADKGY